MQQRLRIAMGGVFALMALFFAGVNRLQGDRPAQGLVALAYAAGVVLLMRWGTRRHA